MTLEQARALMADPHADRRVVYSNGHGIPEHGTVVSVGHQYVFVVYGDDWQAKATSPGDLTPYE